MLNAFSRTELLLGKNALELFKNIHIAIFGIGGVGSYTAEALVRSGIYNFTLIDYDEICLTNINRQVHALRKTIGKSKVDIMKERMLDINPKCNINIMKDVFNKDTLENYDFSNYNYVVDAIDMVTSKLLLVETCKNNNIPIISCMGAGNKLHPEMFEVSDIYKTSVCPLAKVMRKELKKRHVKKLKVVYSKEIPLKPKKTEVNCKTNCICPGDNHINCTSRRAIPGSVSFVPSVAGLIIAAEVVKDLCK